MAIICISITLITLALWVVCRITRAYKIIAVRNCRFVDKRQRPAKQPPQNDMTSRVMTHLDELVSSKKLYRDTELTLESLANEMKLTRNTLSHVINQNTNKNFNSYINEYRVKEAIQIMSDKLSDKWSIDEIGFRSGFNNRVSFYRSFKYHTGISPSDFRKRRNDGK